MTKIDPQRHQMIERAVKHRPEAIADVSVYLWEKLAQELISIIGEGGFQSLFKRSLHLCCTNHPWMKNCEPLLQNGSRFAELSTCLKEQNHVEASAASTIFLTTFIDILALLIGELLTSSILRTAWGDDALDTVMKEFP